MKKSIKIFLITLLIVLVILIFFGIKVFKNYKVFKEMETAISGIINDKNYLYEVNSTDSIVEGLKKTVLGSKIKLEKENSIAYGNIETDEVFLVNLKDNTYVKLSTSVQPQIDPDVFINPPPVFSSLLSKIHNSENDYLNLLFSAKISNDVCDNIECYKISLGDENTTWISKETLLPIKYVNSQAEYTYKILKDVVKEDDVTFNNIENYTEISK